MIEGKDRIRVEWVDAFGRQRTQIVPFCNKVDFKEGMFLLWVNVDEENHELALGVPVIRLIRFAKLKDSEEEVTDEQASEDGESVEDSPVRDSDNAQTR